MSSLAPSAFIESTVHQKLEVLSPNKFSRPKDTSLRRRKLSEHAWRLTSGFRNLFLSSTFSTRFSANLKPRYLT